MLMETDAATDIAAYAADFGNMVHHVPLSVIQPASTGELQHIVQDARARGLTITPRGAAHSTHGQAQSNGGLLLDMTAAMHHIDPIADNAVWVDAGATWRALLAATLPHGLTFPVFTDYIDATIGGTLSVGGVGAQTFLYGTQTDNVLVLEVVTGRGEALTCSPEENADLFDLVRAGLGQFGIIARAQLCLIPAPTRVRFHRLFFADLPMFLRALTTLNEAETFGGIEGFAVAAQDEASLNGLIAQFPGEITGGTIHPMRDNVAQGQMWLYMIEVAEYDPPPEYRPFATLHPEIAGVLKGGTFAWNIGYTEYIARLTAPMNMMKAVGLWGLPHPWINVMISGASAAAVIAETLAETDPADAGATLIYPYRRERLKTPLFRLPAPPSHDVIKFAFLRTARDAEHAQALVAANRRLWERVMQHGGTRYPVDSVPMHEGDWAYQFGERWDTVRAAKDYYDPDGLLAPGQGIF